MRPAGSVEFLGAKRLSCHDTVAPTTGHRPQESHGWSSTDSRRKSRGGSDNWQAPCTNAWLGVSASCSWACCLLPAGAPSPVGCRPRPSVSTTVVVHGGRLLLASCATAHRITLHETEIPL